MKVRTILAVAVICSSAQAAEFVRKKDQISVRAATCSEVKEVADSISKWTERIGEKQRCTISPRIENQSCEADITECAPEHVRRYEGTNPKIAGPNCWNLALVMAGILPGMRSSTADEISFFVRSPLCRNLEAGEPRLPGDLGLIRKNTEETFSKNGINLAEYEEHAFVYVSDKISYSKNGSATDAPFALQSTDGILEKYRVPTSKECRSNKWNPNSECVFSVSFFRCISMDTYLMNHPELGEKTRSALKEVDAVENCMQGRFLTGAPLSVDQITNIAAVSVSLSRFLNSSNRVEPISESERFVRNGLHLRLRAIADNLAPRTALGTSPELTELARVIRKNASAEGTGP